MQVWLWMLLGCVKLLPVFGVVSQVKNIWKPGEQEHLRTWWMRHLPNKNIKYVNNDKSENTSFQSSRINRSFKKILFTFWRNRKFLGNHNHTSNWIWFAPTCHIYKLRQNLWSYFIKTSFQQGQSFTLPLIPVCPIFPRHMVHPKLACGSNSTDLWWRNTARSGRPPAEMNWMNC